MLMRGQTESARRIMTKIYVYAKPEEVELKLKVLQVAVKTSIEITRTTTFIQRFKSMITEPVNRRALSKFKLLGTPLLQLTRQLVVACGLQAFQQLCGFNTLMYYSATLFASIGFDQPTAVGLIVSGTNFLCTLIALKWIDKIGRRRIMIWTSPGMIFGLTLASIAFHCSFMILLHEPVLMTLYRFDNSDG